MSNPLISVIVPVYNVEKYLSQCLESIINQTYRDIEIICINDASTDGSLKILKDYAQKDSRIKIIENEKNIGLGLTRNRGLEVAQGEYVHFVDSDDWLKTNLYEEMQKIIVNSAPQIICFSFISYDESKKEFIGEYVYHGIETLNNKIFVPQENAIIFNNCETVWKHLYKKDFLVDNGIKFTSLACHEDTPFFLETLLYTNRVILVDGVFYYYRHNRPSSLINVKHKHFDVYFEWFNIINDKLKLTSNEKICYLIKKRILFAIISSYENLIIRDTFKSLFYFKKIKKLIQQERLQDYFSEKEFFLIKPILKGSVFVYFVKVYLRYYCPSLLKKIVSIKRMVK